MSYFFSSGLATCPQYEAEEVFTLDELLDAYNEGREAETSGVEVKPIDSTANFQNFFRHFKDGSQEEQCLKHTVTHLAGLISNRDLSDRLEKKIDGVPFQLPRQMHSDDIKFGLTALRNSVAMSKPDLTKEMVSKKFFPIMPVKDYTFYAFVDGRMTEILFVDYTLTDYRLTISFSTHGARSIQKRRGINTMVKDLKEAAESPKELSVIYDLEIGDDSKRVIAEMVATEKQRLRDEFEKETENEYKVRLANKISETIGKGKNRGHLRGTKNRIQQDFNNKEKIIKAEIDLEFQKERDQKLKKIKWIEEALIDVTDEELEKAARGKIIEDLHSLGVSGKNIERKIIPEVLVRAKDSLVHIRSERTFLECKQSRQPSHFKKENTSDAVRFIQDGKTYYFPTFVSVLLKATWEENVTPKLLDMNYEREISNFALVLKELSVEDLRTNFNTICANEDQYKVKKLTMIVRELSQRVKPVVGRPLRNPSGMPDVGAGKESALIRHIAVSMKQPVTCTKCKKKNWHNTCIVCLPRLASKDLIKGKTCLGCAGVPHKDLPPGYFTYRSEKISAKKKRYEALNEEEDLSD